MGKSRYDTMFRFLHAADVHLDSPLRGLARYEGAPVEQIRGATRRALENLVELALAREVDFVLLAGDVYDGDWRDYNTALFLSAQMARLARAGIRVFLIAGNHDAASEITRQLSLPDNVHVFPTNRPETVRLDELGVAIHGQGFARRAVTDDLSQAYPAPAPDHYNIGLLHTSATGRPGHEDYAPCTLDGLVAKGYDYWALGHVHAREILREGEPWIIFPGCLQGRHARETGPKGCTLVTVDDAGRAELAEEHLDVLRWAHLSVDCGGAQDADDAVARVRSALVAECGKADGRLLAVRIELAGACAAHDELTRHAERWQNEIRSAATAESAGSAWVEKVRFHTSPEVDVEALAASGTPIGELLAYLKELAGNEDELAQLAEQLAPLQTRLPAELRRGEVPVDLESPEAMRELLDEARDLLLPRLLTREDAT